MSRRARFWRSARDAAFAVLGLSALALATYFWLTEPNDRPIRLRMTAGRLEGARHRVAVALGREAGRRGVTIELSGTPGSQAALDDVEARRLDLALVQGGLDFGDRPGLRQLAALHVEPLHLLVKEEIAKEVSGNLASLRGKVVNLGERGSGTFCLASEVMSFAGLKPGTHSGDGDYMVQALSYAELDRENDRDRLPDGVFMVSTLPAPVARRLVTAHRYRLVAMPFFDAFALGALEQGPAPTERRGDMPYRIERRHVYDATIPAFTYQVEPGVPAEVIHTLGTRVLLVARKDMSAAAVGRLLEVIYGSPFAQMVQPALDPKALELPPEITWHDGALAYGRRGAPLIAGDVIDLIEKEVSIFGALLGGLFFLSQWMRRRYRRRRDRGFESYILRVAEIERQTLALETVEKLDLGALVRLQESQSRLKNEALEKFADGELEGAELMSGFVTHVDCTRDYLTRLILHERDNLEEQAQIEGREITALWREAVGFSDRAGTENDVRDPAAM